jgi:phospholipid/cholesterol/gamma-HCH transport system substrate-binding protein
MPYSATEKAAGFFLFLSFGLILTIMILVGIGKDWFQSYTNYFALYQEGYGLLPGVKVKFLQTDIGRLKRLEITETNNVKFYITIQSEFARRIKGDSLASIKSPTIIGQEYIEITPGSAESLPIPGNGQIPAADPKTVDDVLAALQLETKLSQFDYIIQNLTSLTYQLQDSQGPILGTMGNLQRITDQVASGNGLIGQLVSANEAYDELMDILRQMKDLAGSLNQTAALLKTDVPNMTATIDKILNQVETGTRSLPEVARGAREGLRDVNQVLDSVKRNFLIRGNLTPDRPPEALTLPARER